MDGKRYIEGENQLFPIVTLKIRLFRDGMAGQFVSNSNTCIMPSLILVNGMFGNIFKR